MLFSVFWVESYENWKYFITIYGTQILFLLSLTSVPKGIINIAEFKKSLIIGATIAASLLVFFPQDASYTEEGRRTIIMFGTIFDPNVVASIMLIGVFLSIEDIFIFKGKKRIISLMVTSLILLGIFFTGSRGALLSFLIGFLFLLLFLFNIKHKINF